MSQHLHLARRQSSGPLPVASHPMAGGSQHGVDGGAVEASGADLVLSRAATALASSASRYGRGSDQAW